MNELESETKILGEQIAGRTRTYFIFCDLAIFVFMTGCSIFRPHEPPDKNN